MLFNKHHFQSVEVFICHYTKFNAAKILIFHVKRARINKNMTKCGNFLCLLVQLRLKITKLTPIFVRLSVKLHISFRSKPSNGYSKLSDLRSKLSDGHPKLCVDTTIFCCKHYTMFDSDSISTVCSDSYWLAYSLIVTTTCSLNITTIILSLSK